MEIKWTNVLITSLIFHILALSAFGADKYIKREVRGAWMATVYCIDWPSETGTTVAIRNKQKKEMTGYLDILQASNMNAVYFQVRPMADALYKSQYEPWSSYVSGTRGRNPGYDRWPSSWRNATSAEWNAMPG